MNKAQFIKELKEECDRLLDTFISSEANHEMIDSLKPSVREALHDLLENATTPELSDTEAISFYNIAFTIAIFTNIATFCKHYKTICEDDLKNRIWRTMFLYVGSKFSEEGGYLLTLVDRLLEEN